MNEVFIQENSLHELTNFWTKEKMNETSVFINYQYLNEQCSEEWHALKIEHILKFIRKKTLLNWTKELYMLAKLWKKSQFVEHSNDENNGDDIMP